MINLMKVHTGFDSSSRFIDIGSGLGKPNLHVAQDPGVEFSLGIEVKKLRGMLSLQNLHSVLQYRIEQAHSTGLHTTDLLGFNCFFSYGDVTDAKIFDPFTHVYMYDIGFPPTLMKKISHIFHGVVQLT